VDEVIGIATVVMVIAYAIASILIICKRKTVWGTVGASLGFLCGCPVIIPLAQAIASIVCWGAAIVLVAGVLGAFSGS